MMTTTMMIRRRRRRRTTTTRTDDDKEYCGDEVMKRRTTTPTTTTDKDTDVHIVLIGQLDNSIHNTESNIIITNSRYTVIPINMTPSYRTINNITH